MVTFSVHLAGNGRAQVQVFSEINFQQPPFAKWSASDELVAKIPGWGDSHMKQIGMLARNFEFNP